MIGQTISHYRIVEKLGEGGMGVVYKAEDTKLHRLVALKFLPPEYTRDTDAKERFAREAQAAAALDHPDICTIYEIDEAQDQTFISMAYIDGERLKDKVDLGPLKIDETLEIAIHVAQGLQAAHEKGIVHRDIKSANVMLTASGQVKVMDFGLAKLTGRTKVTREGTTLGTVGYMSPEQAQGEDADHRSDIWSLGVVLYEMVTGLLPFRGEYEQGLVYQIINSAPAPLTSVRTGVPMELERIVNKCLEKKRDERYQTVADLIADVKHLQRTLASGTYATQQSMPQTAAPVGPIRKQRWVYWTTPVVVLAIVAVVLLVAKMKTPRRVAPPEGKSDAQQTSLPQERPIPEQKSIAVLPFVDMSPQKDQEYFCDGITEELINRLGNIKNLRVPARTSAFYFKGKTGDIREIGSKLNVQTVLEGGVRKAGDQLRITAQLINVSDGYSLWSDTYNRKLEDIFAVQDEISSAIVNALQLKLTPEETQKLSEHPIDNIKAYECYLKAWRQIYRFDEKSLDSAFVYLQTAIDIMGDNAELYAGMATAYAMYANIGMGQEEYLQRSKEYVEKALALKPDLPPAFLRLAILAGYEDYPKNWEDNFRYTKKALSLNPLSPQVLSSMAINYAQIGRTDSALAYADLFEKQDPLNPWRYVVRGLCYQYGCRFEPALDQFRAFCQTDSTSPLALAFYSMALTSNGRRDEAIAVAARIGATARNVETGFCLLLKYALLRDRESAMRLMTTEFQKTCRRDWEWSYYVAARLALLGTKEEALDWLENAIHRGFINYPYIQCDPFLDNIRGDERFKKLAQWAKNEWEHFEVPE
jgi:serine/threonine protein kinase/tetratricopeptide (TPR) repeat protein